MCGPCVAKKEDEHKKEVGDLKKEILLLNKTCTELCTMVQEQDRDYSELKSRLGSLANILNDHCTVNTLAHLAVNERLSRLDAMEANFAKHNQVYALSNFDTNDRLNRHHARLLALEEAQGMKRTEFDIRVILDADDREWEVETLLDGASSSDDEQEEEEEEKQQGDKPEVRRSERLRSKRQRTV